MTRCIQRMQYLAILGQSGYITEVVEIIMIIIIIISRFVMMFKRIYHIGLGVLLTLALTDYVWYDLLSDDQVAIELESEKEESREELKEGRTAKPKHEFLCGGLIHGAQSFQFINSFYLAGEFWVFKSCQFSSGDTRLYIKFSQLRLDCIS